MATKVTVSKISDKLAKINENYTVNMYDNGYMFEVSGRDKKRRIQECQNHVYNH